MADPTVPRQRPIWRIVLVLSLALNLAVVGLVAGFALRDGKNGPPRGVELSLGPIGQALTPDDRQAIMRSLRDNREVRAPRGDGARGGIEVVLVVLNTEPFDPDAFLESLKQPDTRQAKLREALREALTLRVTEMSPAERAAFRDRLQDIDGKRR